MFLDEAAIWLTQPNTATWRTIGSPMAVPTSKARGISARLNLMGVVDFATSEVQYREILGNTTGAEVIAFVDALSREATRRCPTVVVMDRASVHTCKAVAKLRARWKKRGLMVVYLPPYSPELNPMEGKWRLLKYHKLAVRTQKNKQQLRLAVGAAHWGQVI